tara:strand:- start:14 stop:148 length:135 start_codon:yes stop_codon:yes gene_type:complete
MDIVTKVEETSNEDYYKLTIDGVELGTYERSQLRQIIGSIDNVI